MNRVDYNEKAQALLDDQQPYRSASASQAKSMIGQLTGLLSRLRRNNVISPDEWRQTKPTDTALARFYGLPKIHKPNLLLRPIVALKGSPTYSLSKWMSRKLNFLREGSVTSVNSASQFLADIRGKTIQPNQIMVSFDVVSLFTSIPPDLACDVLRKRLEEKYNETAGPLKIQHLMQLFAFCQRTFFTFDGRTCEQIKGTPMGSPISSLVAELVLKELEKVIATVSVVLCIICLILLFSVFQYANVQSMQDLFNDYGKNSDAGQISGIIWNFTMATSGTCCGMDGAMDFANQSTVPAYCCETQNDCPIDEAVHTNVTGCRGKIQSDGLMQMINIMPIFLLLMFAQSFIIVFGCWVRFCQLLPSTVRSGPSGSTRVLLTPE
nr:unnamed protein product [Spirometra erinaceieuropaei]